MSRQTWMSFFLPWSKTGEFLKNTLDALFNIVKVNGDWSCQARKLTKKHHANIIKSSMQLLFSIPGLMKQYDNFI